MAEIKASIEHRHEGAIVRVELTREVLESLLESGHGRYSLDEGEGSIKGLRVTNGDEELELMRIEFWVTASETD